MGLPAQECDAILRDAIMQVKPEYSTWSIKEREKYRVAPPPDEWFRVRQIVLRSLFRIEVATQDEMDAALKGFSNAQRALMSGTLLPLRGVGDNFFWLNESLGDKTLLDFSTLYDYDIWDYRLREDARRKELAAYASQPYRGELYLSSAHLFINGRFHYATLSMAAEYLRCAIAEAGYRKLQNLIPHRYINGKRHGKRTQSRTIWDRRIDAGGMEVQMEKLGGRFWRYLNDRYSEWQQEFDCSARGAVWLLDRSTPDENHAHFVFSDRTALQHVRLRHFMFDCRSRLQDPEILENTAESEKSAVERFLSDSHAGLTHIAV